MNKINYQRLMEAEIEKLKKERGGTGAAAPRLLLHSCCGPCSTYCIKTLCQNFEVTVFYYNPNIYPVEEYHLRAEEQHRFIGLFEQSGTMRDGEERYPLHFVEGHFEPSEFYGAVKGYENEPEGGERCFLCYGLRLEETARYAKENGFDYFTTTLSISPLKNAEKLNQIGGELGERYGVRYLFSDFKKKEGYKQSTELSKDYGMYRQNYCGCVFSKNQREKELADKEALASV